MKRQRVCWQRRQAAGGGGRVAGGAGLAPLRASAHLCASLDACAPRRPSPALFTFGGL